MCVLCSLECFFCFYLTTLQRFGRVRISESWWKPLSKDYRISHHNHIMQPAIPVWCGGPAHRDFRWSGSAPRGGTNTNADWSWKWEALKFANTNSDSCRVETIYFECILAVHQDAWKHVWMGESILVAWVFLQQLWAARDLQAVLAMNGACALAEATKLLGFGTFGNTLDYAVWPVYDRSRQAGYSDINCVTTRLLLLLWRILVASIVHDHPCCCCCCCFGGGGDIFRWYFPSWILVPQAARDAGEDVVEPRCFA